MLGSHIHAVINAGIYDGCYGVLGRLEVAQTLREAGVRPDWSIWPPPARTARRALRARHDGFAPPRRGLGVEEVFARIGTDGTVLGEEAAGIGYAGAPGPASSAPMLTWSCTSSRGRFWSARACQSARWRTCRAFPGRV
jgi:N-carbamoyl-L-amino-acid hydrolase